MRARSPFAQFGRHSFRAILVDPSFNVVRYDVMTREERIAAFYRLLRELPEGPERNAEIERQSGMTDLDFKYLFKRNELAEQRDEAMAEWYEAQRHAWRQQVIDCLTHWDAMSVEDRRTLVVMVRDLFQKFVEELDAGHTSVIR